MTALTPQQEARIVELARFTETKRREGLRFNRMSPFGGTFRRFAAEAWHDALDASAEAFRIAQGGAA